MRSAPVRPRTPAATENAWPSRLISAGEAPRNERWPHTSATASRRFVLPWAFSPAIRGHTLSKGDGGGGEISEALAREFGKVQEILSRLGVQRRIGMTT